jgi:hypothetical protein
MESVHAQDPVEVVPRPADESTPTPDLVDTA